MYSLARLSIMKVQIWQRPYRLIVQERAIRWPWDLPTSVWSVVLLQHRVVLCHILRWASGLCSNAAWFLCSFSLNADERNWVRTARWWCPNRERIVRLNRFFFLVTRSNRFARQPLERPPCLKLPELRLLNFNIIIIIIILHYPHTLFHFKHFK